MSETSNHERLLEALAAHGIRDDIAQAGAILDDVDALVALEARIVQLSEGHLGSAGYTPFAAAQLDATRALLDPACVTADEVSAESSIQHFARLLGKVIGKTLGPADDEDVSLTRAMVASTPFVRADLVFPLRKHGQAPPTPPLELVPHFLVALHTLASLARDAGVLDITFQTVARLFTDFRALLVMPRALSG